MQDPIIHQRGYETPVVLSTFPQFQCFGKIVTANITWSHNLTADPFTLSANRYNATFNREASISANVTTVRVNQTIVFNSSNSSFQTFSNQINIVFLNQTVILDVENLTRDDMLHLPIGQDLLINAN